jgi:competence ComEA-like helix-hairpin-helix protein
MKELWVIAGLLALHATEVRGPRRATGEARLALGEPRVKRLLFGERLRLADATVDELETLPGIGPERARAIAAALAGRRVRTLEELEAVPGIGPATLERLRPFVTLE